LEGLPDTTNRDYGNTYTDDAFMELRKTILPLLQSEVVKNAPLVGT
jgi:hypothetical protein